MKKILIACLAVYSTASAMKQTESCAQTCKKLFDKEFDAAIFIKNNSSNLCYNKSMNKEMPMSHCQTMQTFEYKKQKFAAQALFTACLMKCPDLK